MDFGHSFVRRLEEFGIKNQDRGWSNLSLDFRDIETTFFGIGGSIVRPGPKSMQNTRNMNVISSYNPDVIFLQVGGNDIKHRNVDPKKLARDSIVFAKFIIECYDVKHVIIGQLFRQYSRRNPMNYNELVYDVNKQLTELTGDESKISLWHHRGFWFNTRQYISAYGVHCNNLDMRKFAQSERSAIGISGRRGLF